MTISIRQKQAKERFYRELFAIMQKPPIFKKAFDITQTYNAKHSPRTNEMVVAASLKHLERHGIVKKIRHYEGAWWYLVEGASINWLYK